jgi:AAA domain
MAKASTDPETIRQWWIEYPTAPPAVFPPKPKELKATPYVFRDPKSIPRREFLYGTHLIRKFGSAKFAAGGVGKSALALTEAIAMATSLIVRYSESPLVSAVASGTGTGKTRARKRNGALRRSACTTGSLPTNWKAGCFTIAGGSRKSSLRSKIRRQAQ